VLATPELAVDGIAGSPETGTSTSFSGVGVRPADHARQLAWDGFGIGIRPSASELRADAPESGVIGHGLAQLLGLCSRLALDDCRSLPVEQGPAKSSGGDSELPADIAALSTRAAPAAKADSAPQVDLLTASATGNPNVVRMTVGSVKQQAIREVDSMYVSMPLALAQRLVFGPRQTGASAIVIQLRRTSDMDAAGRAIRRIVQQHGWPLELVSFHEISSVYDQIVENYSMIFQFIATLIVLITLFSIANAINMAISERTGEIGTLRALGFPRATIRSIFIAEGAVIGAVGATLGVVLAIVVAYGVINAGGFSWTPPGRSTPIPIRVEMFSGPWLILGTAIGLILTAILSAIVPASRAARLEITEALRHA
jgi:putative ABC transport system permease protein